MPPRVVRRVEARFAALGPGWQAAAVAAVLSLIDVLGPDGVAPFIYFQF